MAASLLIAAAAVVALTPLLSRFALRYGWSDRPAAGSLKIHSKETPLAGGVAMAVAILLALAVAFALDGVVGGRALLGLAVPTGLLLVLGLIDDLVGLSAKVRLVVQVLAAGLAGSVLVAPAVGGSSVLALWAIQVATAALFLVATVNAVNMQDGMDGLAAALVLLSVLGIAAASALSGASIPPLPFLACAGGLAGFLLFNVPPASVFMGDSGSYFLGMVVGIGALSIAMSSPTLGGLLGSVLLVGVPLFDAGAAVARRLARGVSPLEGDREHLYDLLLTRGHSPWRVLGTALSIQAGCVACGVVLVWYSRS